MAKEEKLTKDNTEEEKETVKEETGGASETKTSVVKKKDAEGKKVVAKKEADKPSEKSAVAKSSVKKEKVAANETVVKKEKASEKKVADKEKTPAKKVTTAKQKKTQDVGTVVVAKVNNLKGGVKKLVLLANSISGLKCDVAVSELEFSKKRVAKDVKNVLQSAIANAQNNHNLDLDRLYVKEAIVGKSYTLKRWRARAKGRGVRILKRFSRMEIKLVER